MDMTQEDNTSGIDRYVGILCHELSKRKNVHFVHVQLVESKQMLFVRKHELENGNTEVQIPLPVFVGGILEELYWIEKYAVQVYELIEDLLPKENLVIHLNTLNLIDLALFMKKRITNCQVITHMHCIPWKSLYNKDKEHFNVLYAQQKMAMALPIEERRKLYVRLDSEWRAYHDADDIICVTRCARDFLANLMDCHRHIHVIPNGIDDTCNVPQKTYEQKEDCIQCLYAGVVSESKGVKFIFKALKILAKQKRHIKLIICGHGPQNIEEQLRNNYPTVDFDYCGLLPFDALEKMYQYCDIGIIPSLQEQSSYVAIEMMKYGMPIITTAVDGLDEMFTDGVDAVKIKPLFSLAKGLYIDENMLADDIADLCDNPAKRERLGRAAQQTFLRNHTAERMLAQTLNIYSKALETQ